MKITEDEIFHEWERPSLDGFARKKLLRAMGLVGVTLFFGAALGYVASLRFKEDSMLFWVLVGAGAAAGGLLVFLVPKTFREISLATDGVPVRGSIVGEAKSKLDGSPIPMIAYTAAGNSYENSYDIKQELFDAHIKRYGAPILLVDPYRPKKAVLEIEVFRLD